MRFEFRYTARTLHAPTENSVAGLRYAVPVPAPGRCGELGDESHARGSSGKPAGRATIVRDLAGTDP